MTELVAVESLLFEAAARDPELDNQLKALGKSVIHSLCEFAVRDPEPNAAGVNQPDLGVAASPAVVRMVFEIVALARAALQIAKASLADVTKLERQLKMERERRGLDAVTEEHIRALAAAAVEPRGSERQVSPES